MRETSIDVYNQIKNEGLLSRLRFQTYEIIFKHGPITQGEAWREHLPHRQRHDIAPRFAELERRGVISVVGRRPCRVTGRVVMLWDITNRLPTNVDKPTKMKCKFCEGRGFVEATEQQ